MKNTSRNKMLDIQKHLLYGVYNIKAMDSFQKLPGEIKVALKYGNDERYNEIIGTRCFPSKIDCVSSFPNSSTKKKQKSGCNVAELNPDLAASLNSITCEVCFRTFIKSYIEKNKI